MLSYYLFHQCSLLSDSSAESDNSTGVDNKSQDERGKEGISNKEAIDREKDGTNSDEEHLG